jgi:multiple sugar transport system ATP-binding protein
MNLVDATIEDRHASFAGFRIPLPPDRAASLEPGVPVILGVRPQDFEDAEFADPALPTIDVEVAVVEELGSATHLLFSIDAPPVDSEAVLAATDEKERAVLLADRRTVFTAEVSESSRARTGSSVKLAVNPARFHFFEPETGETLAREPVGAAAGDALG